MTTNKLGLALFGICFWGSIITYIVRERVRERRDAKEHAAERTAQERLLRRLQNPKASAPRKRFAVVGLSLLALVLICGLLGALQTTAFILGILIALIVLPVMWLCSRRPWIHNLRRPPPITDAQLGKLRFSFGFETCMWRGSIALSPPANVPLSIAGSADGPDPEALSMAKALTAQLQTWQADIENVLFEHYQPYAEALASGELKRKGSPLPSITKPSDVWPLISWVRASIIPVCGELAVELRAFVPWDQEHTLGLLFERGQFSQLCGSVGA